MPPINVTLLLATAIAAAGGPLLALTPLALRAQPQAAAAISVDDGVRRIEPGDTVQYRILARGDGTDSATVRLTVPSDLRDVTADGATRTGATLHWPAPGAGRTGTYTAAAVLGHDTPAGDLAVTACLQGVVAAPMACATDLDLVVEPAGGTGWAWLGAAVFGLLAAVGAIWLDRKIRPELLTPANAHLIYSDAGQPGGAPSA
ncbi:hypothetical protein Cs7R123_28020 [Catellatospora sp. TT07R-123]|uniref:hypothetical protein n=1 Tax=Catellatospora sp. TT07R-123 TaxID=2733863 RepID=UPI001B10A166|nr:hypothetical protein [Catellatospora sp. TT07R-123]GHJ45460.1 hypothetical protein Cs7R123_28020 [Catellatospora sp. TT07R-123]